MRYATVDKNQSPGCSLTKLIKLECAHISWLQDLWGRCAGRNKADAAILVEGLHGLQFWQDAERNRGLALEARVQQLEAQLTQQAPPAPPLPVLQVCRSNIAPNVAI